MASHWPNVRQKSGGQQLHSGSEFLGLQTYPACKHQSLRDRSAQTIANHLVWSQNCPKKGLPGCDRRPIININENS